ncbi:serine hydrolase domain-containing protein [Streptomyces sp. NPDC090445]|uniref:serine hydrolase domain-containing protein n=1 Tax=Streptomyces sp. NPDC090445 TaxID=3365963 RepID=UPI00381E5E65
MRHAPAVLLCTAGLIGATLPAGTGTAPNTPTPPTSAAATPTATTTPAATATATATAPTPAAPRRPCVASPKPAAGDGLQVLAIAEQAKREFGLNSVVLKVSSRGREVVTAALGESMTGVPAEPSMHFRTGSVGIVYMGTILLQLIEEGKASLDDPVARWLPDAPHGSEITLRMLGASTSGLHDYVTNPKFIAEYEAAPFRAWTPEEVIKIAATPPLLYEPGTNWSYSHANFQLLGAALEKISGMRLDRLIAQRISGPLGLTQTGNQYTPQIPSPVLHAFTSERGTYEESTFWNPSWTTAPGAVLVQDICDLERSARAIGSGELLSPKYFRTQLDPGTVGLGKATPSCPASVCLTNTQARHFGLGVIVVDGWILSNPSFSGYAAIQAYLPVRQLSLAVSVTQGPKSPQGNSAQVIAERIAAALAPEQPFRMR